MDVAKLTEIIFLPLVSPMYLPVTVLQVTAPSPFVTPSQFTVLYVKNGYKFWCLTASSGLYFPPEGSGVHVKILNTRVCFSPVSLS